MEVIVDIEANRLENPDKIWCIVAEPVNSEEQFVFENVHENPQEFIDFATNDVTKWIGHNFLAFDTQVINSLLGQIVDPSTVVDTLVISRLLNYNKTGGHSLENWSGQFGGTKVGKEIEDWSHYTPEMLARCRNDVKVNKKIYKFQLPFIESNSFGSAIKLEHRVAQLCVELHNNGFPFDEDRAKELHEEWSKELADLDREIKEAFPPRAKLVREITPKLTQQGTISRQDFRWYTDGDFTIFNEGAPFSLLKWEEFNPGSPKQIVERLNEAGWKPTEKTKGHLDYNRSRTQRFRGKRTGPSVDDEDKRRYYETYGWSVNETNLKTLPDTAPEAARKLVRRLLLASRVSDLEEWLGLCSPPTNGFKGVSMIHGQFLHIGAWTHRMAHRSPNTANIASVQELRELWKAPEGWTLIGTDADGIQMRIFAHYVKDERLIKAILDGNKKDRTDIHSLHQNALGDICSSRDAAKTFIYAFLLGAGVARVAEILSCSHSEAKAAIQRFMDFYPGLADLKGNQIPTDAQRGYFIGLDGRKVKQDSEHLMLGGYLQNGEAIIMKTACLEWNEQLREEKIPYHFANFVHDEWQTLVPSDPEIIEFVSQTQIESIRNAGKLLNLNIPLDAQSQIGYNWYMTH